MMEIPIPLALSRVKIELKNANATKIIVIKDPMIIIINPTLSGELSNNGIPAPIKKANTIENDNPRNKLDQIFRRFTG